MRVAEAGAQPLSVGWLSHACLAQVRSASDHGDGGHDNVYDEDAPFVETMID